ncbi:MAG: prolyl oligopeptidase family serine peptidase, partial [Gemmatimonadales bacterium]
MRSPIRSSAHAAQALPFKAAASLAVFFSVWACSPAYPPPPESRSEPVADTLHGIEFVDPYRWLEDQESPETRAWIDAQNAYAETIIGQSPLRTELETRLAALMDAHDFGSPIRGGDYEYFWLRRQGTELPVIYRRPAPDSSVPLDPEAEYEVIIDPHGWSPDNTVRAEIGSSSHDGRYLIYRVRHGGQDEVEIRIRDLETGADLPDSLPNGLYSSISWNRDGSGFYYSARSRTSGARIRFHRLGTEISSDEELFGQGYGPDKFVGLRQVDGGRYFIYDVWHGWSRIEVYAQDMSNGGPITEIAGPELDARFYPQFHAGKLYMLTNLDAPNNRIVAVDLERPRRDDWTVVIPESADPLQSFTFIEDKLYATYLHDVSPRIKIFELDGTPAGDLAVPELHTASIRSGGEGKAFLTLSSFTQPAITYRIDLDSGERDVWTQRNVSFDPAGFEVKQVWYPSKDGTRIPMVLVHRAGLDLTGDHPTWLAGYGGFLAALTPRFDPMALAFVERGGVYAMANLRGGSEFGERWHRAGMLENKQ